MEEEKRQLDFDGMIEANPRKLTRVIEICTICSNKQNNRACAPYNTQRHTC